MGAPGSVAKIALEGEVAPGAGAGTLFGEQGGGNFAFNDRGEVAFFISLTGPNVTSANDSSLWFSNAARNLTLIAREGSPLEVSPGITRVISGAIFFAANFRGGSGDEDGRANGFNDQSQIAFLASFTDSSSGVFLATISQPTRLANISTRLRVGTGDDALIGGFIITGTQPKKFIVRGIGTSLPFADRLANPTLELRDSSGTLLDSNDDWGNSPNKQAIIDSTIPPSSDLESAIVATVAANGSGYTAIVRGVNDGTGIGVVEAYDLDSSVDSKLANISTRGLVQTGDNVLIAGTIVVGQASQKVIVRAIGPSLTIPGKIANPTLELRDSNGALMEENDDWIDSPNKQAIMDSTIPPTNDLESAIVRTVPPAAYTAIMRGVGDTTGIAVVEVYALN